MKVALSLNFHSVHPSPMTPRTLLTLNSRPSLSLVLNTVYGEMTLSITMSLSLVGRSGHS